MGVYRYAGKKGVTYFIDYYVGDRRVREKVGPNRKKAVERLGKKLEQVRTGTHNEKEDRPMPFSELADEYEKGAKIKKGFRVEKYYLKAIRKHFGVRLLSDITALDVERFKMERKETQTRGKKERSGTAVNRELACLRAMLNKAAGWELIEKNPAAKVKDFPEPPGRNTFLSGEEAGRLLESCQAHLKPIVLCALETGMRKSEILGLRWRDIRDGQIYLTADRTKNGKPREVPISNRLGAEFKRLKAEQGQGQVVALSDLVFRAPRQREALVGGKVKVITGPMVDLRAAWDTAKLKAGIPAGFRFHDLRHTFASHQKMAGTDDFTLMELLGHSDFTMMKRYAHLTPAHKRAAVNRLPEWGQEITGQNLVRNSGGENHGAV